MLSRHGSCLESVRKNMHWHPPSGALGVYILLDSPSYLDQIDLWHNTGLICKSTPYIHQSSHSPDFSIASSIALLVSYTHNGCCMNHVNYRTKLFFFFRTRFTLRMIYSFLVIRRGPNSTAVATLLSPDRDLC